MTSGVPGGCLATDTCIMTTKMLTWQYHSSIWVGWTRFCGALLEGKDLHFLEEVSVGNHFELLQDQVDPKVNEERLVLLQSFSEEKEISLTAHVHVHVCVCVK